MQGRCGPKSESKMMDNGILWQEVLRLGPRAEKRRNDSSFTRIYTRIPKIERNYYIPNNIHIYDDRNSDWIMK